MSLTLFLAPCHRHTTALLPGKAVTLSSGFNHAVAVLENGEAYIWGKMQNPIVKTKGTVPVHYDQLLPRTIDFQDEGVRIIEAFCSSFHTVLRADDGRVFMCGMPNDSRVMMHKPVEVRSIARIYIFCQGGTGWPLFNEPYWNVSLPKYRAFPPPFFRASPLSVPMHQVRRGPPLFHLCASKLTRE